jgi:N,N'-diacetyllegionaminate synthase
VTTTIDIAEGTYGAGRAFVVAEVAQAHDGSLGAAHAFVDAAATAGADAVKFQTHIAAAESSPDEPFRVQFSAQDATRWDYWERLAEHARSRGLAFLSTPFSITAVELLERIGVPAWKIGSGDVGNPELVERVARTGLPVILSSGMSTLEELDAGVELVRGRAPFAILQCTSMYPTPPEKVGLNVLETLRERYGCPVGLSDHSGTIYPSLAAVVLGAAVLEVHLTLTREMFGPDVSASVTTAEFRALVDGVRFLERATAAPVQKDSMAAELGAVREIFTKSVVAANDLEAGAAIGPADLTTRKPGTGIPAARLPALVGRHTRNAVTAGTFLREEDLV